MALTNEMLKLHIKRGMTVVYYVFGEGKKGVVTYVRKESEIGPYIRVKGCEYVLRAENVVAYMTKL